MKPPIAKSLAIMIAISALIGAPAHACRPSAPFPTQEGVWYNDWADIPVEHIENADFIGKVIFENRSGQAGFYPASEEELRARILESTTHPELAGTTLNVRPFKNSVGRCQDKIVAHNSTAYITADFFSKLFRRPDLGIISISYKNAPSDLSDSKQ